MPIQIKETTLPRPQVDLAGPDGNIFVLLGMVKGWSTALGWTPEQQKEFSALCKTQDYDFAVRCIMQAFEEYVDFLVPEDQVVRWVENKNIPVEWPPALSFLEKPQAQWQDHSHDMDLVQKVRIRSISK